MTWILFDTDIERARKVSTLLMTRCKIDILPYQEIKQFLKPGVSPTTILVHCEALDKQFAEIAKLKKSGKHALRFYCTDSQYRMPQIPYVPDDAEQLVM